jgi:uncharacterized protein (DUF58 family)
MGEQVSDYARIAEELAAEKRAQLEGAQAVIKPLTLIACGAAFALAFWPYNLGLLLSLGTAFLAFLAMGLFVSVPAGYVLGRRAARRLKERIGEP